MFLRYLLPLENLDWRIIVGIEIVVVVHIIAFCWAAYLLIDNLFKYSIGKGKLVDDRPSDVRAEDSNTQAMW